MSRWIQRVREPAASSVTMLRPSCASDPAHASQSWWANVMPTFAAAGIVALSKREGYETPKWRNGDASDS